MTSNTPVTATTSVNAVRVGATTTALLVFATILAGTLSPMQSTVNGALGTAVNDGNLAAVISFAVGLIVMIIIIFARPTTRRQALAIPGLIRSRELGWWNYLAGLCGAMVVLSEGVSVGGLGVAVFQIALISGLIVSGVICDRLGVSGSIKQPLTTWRLLGAALAIVATVLTIVPSFHAPGVIALAVLPFAAGLLAGWQPAGNSAVAKQTGSMLVAIGFNFLVGFTALFIALMIRVIVGHATITLPPTWWMYLGGPLGLLSIALMALLVRGIGLLLLGLASVSGQLIGSLGLDVLVPSVGHPLHIVTIIGTVVALVAAGIAMIPAKTMTRLQEHR
ncbi:DMT family transporter [Curtobacterium sp. MWU13-2055]|uniref:DMT family transporter n=1 Tax=Curtobacterium sp. MWU13-2055 TaxID=2931928 RepID=UPI00200EED30|nr:DMT family transporter [Curtobacterium sp. MWU13-2055]